MIDKYGSDCKKWFYFVALFWKRGHAIARLVVGNRKVAGVVEGFPPFT
jgi:hypothetical protein